MSSRTLVWVGVGVGVLALGGAFRPQDAGLPAKVTVVSEPSQAEVWLDGKSVGRTPTQVELTSGHHQVEFQKTGFRKGSAKVSGPVVGQVLALRLEPELATLQLKDPGEGSVRLGPGVPRTLSGKGPWKLEAGDYELWIERGKLLSQPKKFALKAGQTTEVAVNWPTVPTPAQLSQPVSAPVRVASPARPVPAPPAYQPPAVAPPSQVYVAPRYEPPPYRPSRPRPVAPPPRDPEPIWTPIPIAAPAPAPAPVDHPSEEGLFTPLP